MDRKTSYIKTFEITTEPLSRILSEYCDTKLFRNDGAAIIKGFLDKYFNTSYKTCITQHDQYANITDRVYMSKLIHGYIFNEFYLGADIPKLGEEEYMLDSMEGLYVIIHGIVILSDYYIRSSLLGRDIAQHSFVFCIDLDIAWIYIDCFLKKTSENQSAIIPYYKPNYITINVNQICERLHRVYSIEDIDVISDVEWYNIIPLYMLFCKFRIAQDILGIDDHDLETLISIKTKVFPWDIYRITNIQKNIMIVEMPPNPSLAS